LILALVAFSALCHASEGKLFLPRLPLSVLLQGNLPLVDDSKIVGGVVTQPGELPFQIELQRCSGQTCSLMCGGSILDETTILNAAHCVRGVNANSMQVVAGEYSRSQDSGDEQIRSVSRTVAHGSYNQNTYVNDISIIKLSSPLVFNSMVAPVNLPPAGFDPPVGTVATVSGWGTTSSGGSLSDLLRKVDVPIISDADCDAQNGAGSVDGPTMICAALPEGGVDSCQGDSGGPLFTGTGANAVQHGVVSWGYGCAVAGKPGVYAQVSNYIDWIAANRG